jgi:hypothetical protein
MSGGLIYRHGAGRPVHHRHRQGLDGKLGVALLQSLLGRDGQKRLMCSLREAIDGCMAEKDLSDATRILDRAITNDSGSRFRLRKREHCSRAIGYPYGAAGGTNELLGHLESDGKFVLACASIEKRKTSLVAKDRSKQPIQES